MRNLYYSAYNDEAASLKSDLLPSETPAEKAARDAQMTGKHSRRIE